MPRLPGAFTLVPEAAVGTQGATPCFPTARLELEVRVAEEVVEEDVGGEEDRVDDAVPPGDAAWDPACRSS